MAPTNVTRSSRGTAAPRRVRLLTSCAALLAVLAGSLVAAGPADAASRLTPSRTEARYATAVVRLINAERHAHHLPALHSNWRLRASAMRHDRTMARHNRMSHRLRGEAYFTTRISRAGYRWNYAGENIGWSSWMSESGVLYLERYMYAERAPYDGHRRNILDRHYRDVGVAVHLDRRHHKVWLTVDFGRQ